MSWESIDGWFDFHDTHDLAVQRCPDGGTLVEIGCWLGRSTAYLAQAVKQSHKAIKLYAVDNWAGSGCDHLDRTAAEAEAAGNSIHDQFVANMKRCGVMDIITTIRTDSALGASHFADGSVDFAFIDADHRYEAVVKDIKAWLPKIKPGGILAGHDYERGDVEQAVRDCLGGHKSQYAKGLGGRVWWYEVPNPAIAPTPEIG